MKMTRSDDAEMILGVGLCAFGLIFHIWLVIFGGVLLIMTALKLFTEPQDRVLP